jgi:predicted dehydrogenase
VIEQFAEVAHACTLDVAADRRLPIAVVGAGAIVDIAHLPAYRAGGLEVLGIFDIDESRARDAADRHGIATVYDSLADLLDDERVHVVDVAVTAHAQPSIVQAALESGRHVLGQKPFAPTAGIAADLADIADTRGLVLAVNQQLRFDEGMAAAHRMVELGWLGTLTAMTIEVDIWTAWESWPWMLHAPRLEVMNHSIHYHDVIRWFLGEPTTVYCAGGRTPGQAAAGETRTVTTCRYASGAVSMVHANHENSRGDNSAVFRIDGTHGSIRGTLGLLYDYPGGRPDTVEVNSSVLPTDGWLPYPVTTRWIPDAFLGPMGSVMDAVATGTPPRTSARDNIATLRLVEAIYASMHTGRAQAL